MNTFLLKPISPTYTFFGNFSITFFNPSFTLSSSLADKHKSTKKNNPLSPIFPWTYYSICWMPRSRLKELVVRQKLQTQVFVFLFLEEKEQMLALHFAQ